MEQYNQSLGFIVYETTLAPSNVTQSLDIGLVRDRVHVYVDDQFVVLLQRWDNKPSIVTLPSRFATSQLRIIVENMGYEIGFFSFSFFFVSQNSSYIGRVNFGHYLNTERKGLSTDGNAPTLNGNELVR